MNPTFKSRAEVFAAGLEPYRAAQAIEALPPEEPPPPPVISEAQRQQLQAIATSLESTQSTLDSLSRRIRENETSLPGWRQSLAAMVLSIDPRNDAQVQEYGLTKDRIEIAVNCLATAERNRDVLCLGVPARLLELDTLLNRIFPPRRRARDYMAGGLMTSRLSTAMWAVKTVLGSGRDIPDPPLAL